MSFTVTDFEDLLKIIEARPEWRSRLRRALFPEIDVPKALQALAEAQLRTEATLQRLEVGQKELKQDVSGLKRDVGILKGRSQEQDYYNKATSIFGRYLRKGHDASEAVADQLHEALQDGRITDAEYRQVLATDLLWGGEERQTKHPLILAMEASWLAETSDVVRAQTRANVLQRLGLTALAVVGGAQWTDAATELARAEHIVRITDRSIDPDSWQAAWSNVQDQHPD